MFQGLSDALRQLSPTEYRFLQLLLLVLLLFLLYRLRQNYVKLRLLTDTPSSRIASAAQGQVELQGLAEWMRGDRIHSPFSGERCVWYRCRVERRQRVHRSSQWVEDSLQVSEHPFRLVDESGECIVDPVGARVLTRYSRSWYGYRSEQRHQPGLAGLGWGLCLNPRYRFSEQLIRVADSLHVVGEFETHHHRLPAADEEQRVREIVSEWKKYPERYLRVFDRDDDGRIGKEEWPAVYDRARHHLHEARGPAIHHVRKPADGRFPFLISAFDESQLLRRYQRGLLWSLLGFILLLYLLLFAASVQPW